MLVINKIAETQHCNAAWLYSSSI